MRNIVISGVIGFLGVIPVASAASPSQASQQRVESGRQIYQQFCAACHGVKGEGQPGWQKRNVEGELPAPPHDSTGHTWKHSDAMLYRLIKNGWRDPFNKTERVTMPAFGATLSPGEIRAVVDYLKTLWTPSQRSMQRKESKQAPFPAETSNAEKVKKLPG